MEALIKTLKLKKNEKLKIGELEKIKKIKKNEMFEFKGKPYKMTPLMSTKIDSALTFLRLPKATSAKSISEKQNKEFIKKNVGKKTKTNPVREDELKKFVKSVNDSSDNYEGRRPGMIDIIDSGPVVEMINRNIGSLEDYRSGFFTHPPQREGDVLRATLVGVQDSKIGLNHPFTMSERNMILKGIEHQIKARDLWAKANSPSFHHHFNTQKKIENDLLKSMAEREDEDRTSSQIGIGGMTGRPGLLNGLTMRPMTSYRRVVGARENDRGEWLQRRPPPRAERERVLRQRAERLLHENPPPPPPVANVARTPKKRLPKTL